MARKLNAVSKRAEYFDPILNPNLDQKKFGEYSIIEWSDPQYVNSDAFNRFNKNISFEDRVKLCQ